MAFSVLRPRRHPASGSEPQIKKTKVPDLDASLIKAVSKKQYDECLRLIKLGANVNNYYNISLLHNAALLHTSDICVLLVDNGADVLCKDICGNRASDYCHIDTRLHHYLKQKETEREILNQSFKRAHIEDDDEEEPEILLEENDKETI